MQILKFLFLSFFPQYYILLNFKCIYDGVTINFIQILITHKITDHFRQLITQHEDFCMPAILVLL